MGESGNELIVRQNHGTDCEVGSVGIRALSGELRSSMPLWTRSVVYGKARARTTRNPMSLQRLLGP